MRTKTLLLTAALSAATIASAFAADSVYSINVVGYATDVVTNAGKAMAQTWSLKANPLLNMQSELVTSLIPSPPPGTILYIYNTNGIGTFEQETFDLYDLIWVPGTNVLKFGSGFWLFSTPFTITWTGEVAEGLNKPELSNMNLKNGWNLVGSRVPQHGTLAQMYTDATPGNVVYKYDVTNSQFITATFDQYDLVWVPDPNGMELNIGDGLWILEAGSPGGVWNRNFSIPRN